MFPFLEAKFNGSRVAFDVPFVGLLDETMSSLMSGDSLTHSSLSFSASSLVVVGRVGLMISICCLASETMSSIRSTGRTSFSSSSSSLELPVAIGSWSIRMGGLRLAGKSIWISMDGEGADVVDGEEDVEKLDDEFVQSLERRSFGVQRPSVESGLGHVSWADGD